MGKQSVCVLVTEAAGEIGDALVHKIAGGMMLGPDQPMILHMHYNPGFAKEMNGGKMDLVDSAFPLVKGVVATTDVVEACTGVNIAIMVKGEQGMESKAVMAKNDLIYESLASALEQHAASNCKVLIVANPAETIALALKDFAPSIPKENVTCLTRLDHNRALGLISERLNVPVSDVKNVIVWGYDPFNWYLDVSYATVKTASGEKRVHELVADDAWLHGELIATVQQRGAAIIKAGKKSCALSVAKSACDHIHDWVLGTPKGTWVPMGVYSDGSYNVPVGLIHSFPVTCRNGKWEIVQDLCNYKPTHHHQEEQWTANSDTCCTICISDVGELERGKINCCEHYFHSHCIIEWSERTPSCPNCKGRFSTVECVYNDANQGIVNVIVNVPIRDQGHRLSLDTNQGNANVILNVPVRDQGNTATQQPTDGSDIRDWPPNTTQVLRRRNRSASSPLASSSFH